MDDNNNIKKAPNIPPFLRYCSAIIPTAFDDSLSYYEALCALYKYLQDNIVDVINNNATVTEYYINLVKELKSYVENYFDNLDVQEEINNKLDEMTEDGTLQEIITAYIQSNVAWTFDTVEDMKAATNLVAGSYARTLGFYSANDNGGALYKILNSGTADEHSIIAVGSLKAHLIADETVNVDQFGAVGDDSTDDTEAIQAAIDYATANLKRVCISEKTYRVSQIVIANRLEFFGCGNGYDCQIKSIDGNTQESIVEVLNGGLFKSNIYNFCIDGNKENNSNSTSGLRLHVSVDGTTGDKFTNVHDIYIINCTKYGFEVKGDLTTYDVRELRIDNIDVYNCDKTGVYIASCTDSMFSRISSHRNVEYGFDIESSNNRFENCKAFWNGYGDGTTLETISRIPNTAFTATTDASPVTGKTYYTRSGNNVNNDWYIFAEFTGSTFDGGTTYYELTTPYYKHYAGYYCKGTRCEFVNCEAQDNFGDGFTVATSGLTFEAVLADNNGLVVDADQHPISYETAGLTPLYYGFYITGWQTIITGQFRNFRYGSTGTSQKGAVMVWGSGELNGTIYTKQPESPIYTQNAILNTIKITQNSEDFCYDATGGISVTGYNTTVYGGYARKVRNTVFLNMIVDDTTNDAHILPDSNERTICRLPAGLYPKTEIKFAGFSSGNHGYNLHTMISGRINTNGYVTIRNSSAVNDKSIVIPFTYTTL